MICNELVGPEDHHFLQQINTLADGSPNRFLRILSYGLANLRTKKTTSSMRAVPRFSRGAPGQPHGRTFASPATVSVGDKSAAPDRGRPNSGVLAENATEMSGIHEATLGRDFANLQIAIFKQGF